MSGVNKARRRLRAVDHLAGLVCAIALFYWSAEIATVVSDLLARMLEGLKGGSRIYFVGGVYGLHVVGVLAGLAVLGLAVAGFDRLVVAGRLRGWAPPFAVFAVAAAAMIPFFRSGGADVDEAAVLGTTAAVLLSLGFSAWWAGGLLSARIRRGAGAGGISMENAG